MVSIKKKSIMTDLNVSNNQPVTITLAHEVSRDYKFIFAGQKTIIKYYPFTVHLSPAEGPPGDRNIDFKVNCPICNNEVKIICRQQTVLFTKPDSFKSKEGKSLKKLIYKYLLFNNGDLIPIIGICAMPSLIPSAIWPLFFNLDMSVLRSNAGNMLYFTGFVIGMLLWTLLFSSLIKGYQYVMFSKRNSVIRIRKPHLFRPEFQREAFNIFTRINVATPSQGHYCITHCMTKNLLSLYGLMPCNIYV